MKRRHALRRIFVTGAFIVMPTLVTLFLLNFALGQVDVYFTPWFLRVFDQLDLNADTVPDAGLFRTLVPVLGLLAFLGTILLVGLLGSHYIGKRAIEATERTILRVPLVSSIYGSAKQLFEAFSVEHGESFSRVVLIEYPRRGVYALAFVTKHVHPAVQGQVDRDDLVFVFVPTTPNPTSGFLLALPESELVDTGLTVEAGLKTIVSGGMVQLGPADVGAVVAAPPAPRAAPDRTEDAQPIGIGEGRGD